MEIAIMNYNTRTITLKEIRDGMTIEEIEEEFEISSDYEYYMTAEKIEVEDLR